MSQNVVPDMAGQIDAPSRLELFWENNKRVVYMGLVAAAAALGINYAWQYKEARNRSEAWSALAVAAKLDEGYSQPGSLWAMIQESIKQNPQFVGWYYGAAQSELVADLTEDVKGADETALKTLVAGSDGRAPLALWVLANQSAAKSDFETAVARLEELKQRFPKHFLCVDSGFPVQWRPEVKEPEPEPTDPPTPKPKKKADLEPVRSGSLVGLKLQQIAEERAFRLAHPEYYAAPEPDSSETVVFDLENGGTIKVKFFSSRAPKHVARLLELAKESWWLGQRVHQVERAPSGQADTSNAPNHFVLGWPSTKDDDRAKWKEEDVAAANLLDWEQSGVSHFAGMVSVEAAKDGKSQVERLVFNAEDEGAIADGTRMVIGRVVAGLEVVREIVSSEFADDAGAKSGRGRPLEGYKVTAVRIE